ncbi:uncharacterized protein LOC106871206 [Octopus bimaculoides]|uniref:Uncharacterized protein n=1 Tax=Octopus bimaculoides TaxID=37653 RepID=A0A0L8HE66_OCTBM|nr:uncharacterized protein LOC106871206 [Octopus bimaculoides]XP_014773040.1 uncharacterized protein LOC106871206 [Octopus bimaculoides]|eukprot:XP_014773039.1 PREDICTED: uncharacterized protein LOC106871206 [Octopus bimaculoides]
MPRRKKRRRSGCRTNNRPLQAGQTSSITRWVHHPSSSSATSSCEQSPSVCTIRTMGKKPKEISITCIVEDGATITEDTTILRQTPQLCTDNSEERTTVSTEFDSESDVTSHVPHSQITLCRTTEQLAINEGNIFYKLKHMCATFTFQGTTWNNMLYILLPFALLSISMLIATFCMGGASLTQQCDTNCYSRYSKALYQLQKNFRCQNVWLWLTLRSVVWNVFFEPKEDLPGVILFVVPLKMTDTGYNIALNVVEIFNALHGHDVSTHIKFGSIGMTGLALSDFQSKLYLEIETIQSKCQPAVLTDHLEMVSGVDINFITYTLVEKLICNKLFVFTIYVPLHKANPLKIPEYLWEIWQTKETEVNSLIARLTENMVFISATD